MACMEIINPSEITHDIVINHPESETYVENKYPFDPNYHIDFGHYAVAAKLLVAPAVMEQTQLDNANFIIDSGSGHHIVSNRHQPEEIRQDRAYQLWGPSPLATANGIFRPDRGFQISIDPLNITTGAFVLEYNPAVLSLGKLCQISGFTFNWQPGSRPILTGALGFSTELEVRRLRVLDQRDLRLPDHGQRRYADSQPDDRCPGRAEPRV